MANAPDNTHDAPDGGASEPSNFVRDLILRDLALGTHQGRVVTRFPPEPNGYLHIGHAKAICIDFGVAADIPGNVCHLRFDDTNPVKEDTEFVDAIQRDVKWLGFDWQERLFYASDYFERIYQFAEELIGKGLAYVCSLSEEDARRMRGSIAEAGTPSPDRDRPIAESLALFRRMRAGEFRDGELVLRAKIDMAAANMKMRDPAIYRIRHTHHHRTGDAWCIYPLYDFTHCLSDSLEGITHSLCTVEFESARELYDWFLDHLDVPARPHQYEFAPLNLTYVVVSKRKLRQLVESNAVSGWDDPRMPTLSALRRRGFVPEGIRSFIRSLGVAKNLALTDVGRLEAEQRAHLDPHSKRVLAVLDPLKVVITNLEPDEVVTVPASFFPDQTGADVAERQLTFGREIAIERADFALEPPPKFKRLTLGGEVRLRHAFVMRCDEVIQADDGSVSELRCTIDRATLDAAPTDGRRVAGTIHWVSLADAVRCEVRIFDRLFTVEQPDTPDGPDFTTFLNPESLVVHREALIEPSVTADDDATRYQFERHGYFWRDPVDSSPDHIVFNRTVSLKDGWAKIAQATLEGKSVEHAKQEARALERKARKEAQARLDRDRAQELSPAAQELVDTLGLAPAQALVLVSRADLRAFFEQTVALGAEPRLAANWTVTEVSRLLKDDAAAHLTPGHLQEVLDLVATGAVSARAAKDVLTAVAASGKAPALVVAEEGLGLQADPAKLAPIVDEVLSAFADKVAAYRAGNANLMGLFVGQVMKRSGGKADPQLVGQLIRAAIDDAT